MKKVKRLLIKNSFIKLIVSLIKAFLLKILEIIVIFLFVLILLFPIFNYCILKQYNIISFENYKELLEITLNSKFTIVTSIIIIVYIFRNAIRKKIEKLKNAGKNGVEFFEETQIQKMINNKTESRGETDEKYDELYMDDDIYMKIKSTLNPDKSKNNQEISLEETNENLLKKVELLSNNLKKEKFKNIENRMAKTTNTVLLTINGIYKYHNSFNKNYIKKVLEKIYKNFNMDIDLEVNAIYNFLQTNNFIDTEDDDNFSINEKGSEFLEYLFEGGE